MSASYPSAAKSFTTKTDGSGQTIFAAHINDLQDEVVAVETALVTNGLAHGLKPSAAGAQDLGTASLPWGTVRTRALNFDAVSALTIAGGIVTATRSHHSVDTEAAAATDDLDTITATGLTDGFVLVLRPANVAHVVTLKDGTGNLLLNGDYALSATDRTITLVFDGTNWRELARSVARTANTSGYTPTIADVANTAVETTALSFSVPANEMADGDVIVCYLLVKTKNGAAGTTPTYKVKWGASSATMTSIAWSNANVDNFNLVTIQMQRAGADLYIADFKPTAMGAVTQEAQLGADLGAAAANSSNIQKISAPTFSSTQTVVLTVQFSVADATLYFKPLAARVLKVASS